ncbi:hypothetical protein HZY83_02960 [Gemella sp. GH3]|uniref:SemiSWEET family transporter n=1 Tax=unclassified Gemella TaxID=2624949 RepID=UPI0015D0B825|nr:MULTISPECIES: SemiSWEET family transporter [unclassified Gemella]MBF0713640.1 hypothetical protein [Gemella sp. GH3.1]NYS50592.1 hypothetical protein [Gemella sp. GH3]
MTEKNEKILGWIATTLSVLMYVAYIPQIANNLNGNKGDFIQPLVAAINCTLWVSYGLLKKNRDIPLAAANAPGIVFGIMAVLTALL